MANENIYLSSVKKITPLIFLMFLILISFSILDKVFDLPHVFFSSIKTPVNWNEIIIEVSFISIVSVIVIYFLKKLITIQVKSETDLHNKNQEYYALNEEYQAQNEEFFTNNEELIQEIEKRKLVEQQLKSQSEQFVTESYNLGVNSYIVKSVYFQKFAESIKDVGFYWLILNQSPV